MKMISRLLGVFILIVSLFSFQTALAQQGGQPDKESAEKKPTTKLEAFQAQTGGVLIKGFTIIGNISAMGSIEVSAMEFKDASSGKRQTGVVIEVKETGRFENTIRSFIDYDEVDSLIKGIDYISRATPEVTRLKHFEATYKTKGSFNVTTFSTQGKISAVVSSGYIRQASAFISLQQLAELRDMIERAKQVLGAAT